MMALLTPRLCLILALSTPCIQAFFRYTPGQVLVLDHLNINHEKSRHDLVRAFYYDMLGLVPDPRKAENMEKGRKTLWANAGITQFHLPEAEKAQVLDGELCRACVCVCVCVCIFLCLRVCLSICIYLDQRRSSPSQVLDAELWAY